MNPESVNNCTEDIDILSTYEIVKLINDEDMKVAIAVNAVLEDIARAVDVISNNFLNGGRLLYFGAGTSGRLAILDASECPPTFSVASKMVQGVIAGGDVAIKNAVEGAEDSVEFANKDFNMLTVTSDDTVVGISASGNAAYVVEVLRLAKAQGVKTVCITSNPTAKMLDYSDCKIVVETGAEVITGSTRMKAGTAQKMILNMLTTGAMIKIGKTYRNLMVDLNPSNKKLKIRAASIVASIAKCTEQQATKELEKNSYKVKHAILKLKYGVEFNKADELLKLNHGILRKIFQSL